MMLKVTLVTAVRKAGKGNGCRDGGSGSFRARWEGENMKCLCG